MLAFERSVIGNGVMVPDAKIMIEGMPLMAPIMKSITHISVSQLEHGSGSFTLQIYDPVFALIDTVQGVFLEGKRVEIMLGYVGQLHTLIVGDIESVSVDLDEGGGLTVQVMGHDRLHAGTRGTEYREFAEKTSDSEAVRVIAVALLLTPSVEQTESRTDQLKQNNVSNLQFLKQLAERNKFILWVDGSTLHFKQQRNSQQTTVARGRDLISFSANLNTSGHVDCIEVRGWNTSEKTAFSAEVKVGEEPGYSTLLTPTGQAQVSKGGSGQSKRVIYTSEQVNTIAEAKKLAEKYMQEQKRSLITARGSAVGNTSIQAGTRLKLENMGRFNGNYIIESTNHDFGASGYRTSFTLRTDL